MEFDILELLRKKDVDKLEEIIRSKGRKEAVSLFGDILDKRAYFTIDENGNIGRKIMNYALSAAAFSESDRDVSLEILESAKPSERVKLKKIERLSKETMENLVKNFMKVMANNNVSVATRYAKELISRDSDLFYRKLFHYTLLEPIDSQKSLMALSLKKLMGRDIEDNLIHLAISYIAKVKCDFTQYENSPSEDTIIKSELIKMVESKSGMLKCRSGMNLLAYVKVLNEYDYENERKFISIALKKLKDIEGSPQDLSKTEAIIYKGLQNQEGV